MKTKSKLKTDKRPQQQTMRVEFHAERAHEVCIAGSFNDWHPGVTPMIRLSGGRWAKELSLAPGRYEYRLVVDGEWICDPAAAEKVPNPFGGCNALLIVPPAGSERKRQP